MSKLGPWRPKKLSRLGNGATVLEEGQHFVHEMGNLLMILMMRSDLNRREGEERRAAYLKGKKILEARRLDAARRRIQHE